MGGRWEMQANYVITHQEMESLALEATAMAGVDKRYVYTMGKEKSTEGLRSVK